MDVGMTYFVTVEGGPCALVMPRTRHGPLQGERCPTNTVAAQTTSVSTAAGQKTGGGERLRDEEACQRHA